MKNEVVIKLEGVSKYFQIYAKPHHRLFQGLLRGRKRYFKEFCALRDISFKVKRAETVGIIGRNGAGKSTLLQIICGTLAQTSGSVEVNGRVAALLELGSGFNPEFTGKENVYMNSAILGLSKKEIDARYEEIISFADIGDFVDQPVKNYSSGMTVRLAFAVQVVIKPDILIVDEALSVGDFFFQQKCFRRIKELQTQGTTLLFVSHDMSVVRDLCRKGLYLKNGEVAYWGENLTAIREYLSEVSPDGPSRSNTAKPGAKNKTGNCNSLDLMNDAIWKNSSTENHTDQQAEILAVGVYDVYGKPAVVAEMGTEITIRVSYRTFTDAPVHVMITFKNKYDQIIAVTGSYFLDLQLPILHYGEINIFELRLKLMLEAGLYTFSTNVGAVGDGINTGTVFFDTPWLGPLQIVWDYENRKSQFLGMFGVPARGNFLNNNKSC